MVATRVRNVKIGLEVYALDWAITFNIGDTCKIEGYLLSIDSLFCFVKNQDRILFIQNISFFKI